MLTDLRYVFRLLARNPRFTKVERGHAQDLEDVRRFLESGLVDRAGLREYFEAIVPQLHRYPALDPPSFRRAGERATGL